MGSTYDFVIVGAGPAGCLLARRLATAFRDDQILLIEAGGDNKAKEHQGFGDRNFTLATAPGFNWGYKTVPQEHLGRREIDYSRGKGLGGSTAINFCAWTRGPSSDYDRWAQIVEDGTWSWRNVQERYKKIENVAEPPTEYRRYVDLGDKVSSANGYLSNLLQPSGLTTENREVKVGFPKGWDPDFGHYLDNIYRDGYPRALDVNSGDPIGLGVLQSSISDTSRVTAATAFLSDAPANLTILTGHVVERIVVDGRKVQGVATESETIFARKEVILSAGALDTPKLLLLSGVGPKSELEKLDIPCVKDLPGIGKNLQDRLFMELVTIRKPGMPHRSSYLMSSPETLEQARKQWAQDETGPFSDFFLPQMIGYMKSQPLVESEELRALDPEVKAALQAETAPHLELISVSVAYRASSAQALLLHLNYPRLILPRQHVGTASVSSPEQYIGTAVGLMSLQSRGTVTLRSKNPADPPIVDPNFLHEAFDKRVAIEAVREAMKFLNSPGLKKDHVRFAAEPDSLGDEDILAFVSKTAVSMWHMCGTVAMGKPDSPDTCVDTDFRLQGLDGLRVVDMSVAPFLPSAHTQAIAYLIGQTAAEKMVAEYSELEKQGRSWKPSNERDE
ncbi:MAG: hypothetical protein Q9218_005754 [Villophora microphyllina]